MELKSYAEFKRKLAVMTGPKMATATTTTTTTTTTKTEFAATTSRNEGENGDIGSGSNKRLKLGPLGLALSPSPSPLASLSPSPIPPMFAVSNNNNNNNNYNNKRGNNSLNNNKAVGNIPFAASNWWKNGSTSATVFSKPESLLKVKCNDNTDKDDKDETAATATATLTATATTARTVSSPSSPLTSSKTKSPSSPSKTKTTSTDVDANTTVLSIPTHSLETQSPPPSATVVDSADIAEAETPSWLQLLRDVAASGKTSHRQQQKQKQHQQQLSASHYQEDPLISGLPFPLFRNNNNNNDTGGLFTNQQQQQNQNNMIASVVQAQQQQMNASMPIFDPSAFSNVLSQQQQKNGMMMNHPSFSFPQVRTPPSHYTQHSPQQHIHLQNQQRLQLELQRQRGMQQQQQLQYQQYQHQYQCYQQQQQQQQQQTNISSVFQSLAGGREQERQQMKQPSPVRAETNIIDALRSSSSVGRGGDIINADIADVPSSPDVERELEESYEQDASFDEGEENNDGLRGINDNTNRNIAQLSSNNANNNNIKNNNIIVNVDDEEDLDFSDIDGTVPDIAMSEEVGPVNCGDKMIDHAIKMNGRNYQMKYTSGSNECSTEVKPTKNLKEVKFRAYQAENWTGKFEELLQFRDMNGHCLVPNCHPDNPALAQWTKRQRYQYKLKMDGKRSTITDERVRALDEAGFVWDSHKAVWAERLEELKEFRKEFGHCNVPSRYQTNHQLAIWVKRQRRQWKNKMDSQPNCMTDERQRNLEALGFVWDMKKKQTKTTNQTMTMKKIKKDITTATTASTISNM